MRQLARQPAAGDAAGGGGGGANLATRGCRAAARDGTGGGHGAGSRAIAAAQAACRARGQHAACGLSGGGPGARRRGINMPAGSSTRLGAPCPVRCSIRPAALAGASPPCPPSDQNRRPQTTWEGAGLPQSLAKPAAARLAVAVAAPTRPLVRVSYASDPVGKLGCKYGQLEETQEQADACRHRRAASGFSVAMPAFICATSASTAACSPAEMGLPSIVFHLPSCGGGASRGNMGSAHGKARHGAAPGERLAAIPRPATPPPHHHHHLERRRRLDGRHAQRVFEGGVEALVVGPHILVVC